MVFRRLMHWVSTLDPDGKPPTSLDTMQPAVGPPLGLLEIAQGAMEPVTSLNPDPGPIALPALGMPEPITPIPEEDTMPQTQPDNFPVEEPQGNYKAAYEINPYSLREGDQPSRDLASMHVGPGLMGEDEDLEAEIFKSDSPEAADTFTADYPEGDTEEDFDNGYEPNPPVAHRLGSTSTRDIPPKELRIPSKITYPAADIVAPQVEAKQAPAFSSNAPGVGKLREAHTILTQLAHENLDTLDEVTHAEDLIRITVDWLKARIGGNK